MTASFLAQLPPQQRMTLLLVYGEGFDLRGRRPRARRAGRDDRLAADAHQCKPRRPLGRGRQCAGAPRVETLYPRDSVMTELSDELLVAYVDGQLAREQTSAVEKVLKQDDVIARRVDALKEAHSRSKRPSRRSSPARRSTPRRSRCRARPSLFIAMGHAGQGRARRGGHRGRRHCLLPAMAGRSSRLNSHGARSARPIRACRQHPARWQDEAARAQALLTRASLEVGLTAKAIATSSPSSSRKRSGRISKCRTSSRKDFASCALSCCNLAASRSRKCSISARAARRSRFTPRRARGRARRSSSVMATIGGVAWSEDGISYLLAGDEDEATCCGSPRRSG